jgi:Cu(I)/Ag(I) efflux system membrane fusion protein
MRLVKDELHFTWVKDLAILKSTKAMILIEADIKKARIMLSRLSDQLYHTFKKFKVEIIGFRQFCPKAFNNSGGFWLSASDKIINPYFGDAMLNCENIEEELN